MFTCASEFMGAWELSNRRVLRAQSHTVQGVSLALLPQSSQADLALVSLRKAAMAISGHMSREGIAAFLVPSDLLAQGLRGWQGDSTGRTGRWPPCAGELCSVRRCAPCALQLGWASWLRPHGRGGHSERQGQDRLGHCGLASHGWHKRRVASWAHAAQ